MAENNVLIISANTEITDNLAIVCRDYGFASISASDGTNVRNTITEKNFGLILLNTPLENEFGLELAAFISENTDSMLIILAAQKNCDEIDKKIGSTDAYVLPKPLSKPALIQAIRFVSSAKKRQSELEQQNKQLETKLHNLKQIDRAKCVLIQYLRISEADAHRQIQKRAMDQHIPEVEVAMDILRTYEM